MVGVDHDPGVGHGDVPIPGDRQGLGGAPVQQADGTRGGPGDGRAALGRGQRLDLVAGLAEHPGEGIVDLDRWGDDLDGGVAELTAVDPRRGDLGRGGPAGDVAVGVGVVVFPAGRAGQAGDVGVQVVPDVLNRADRVGWQGDYPGQGGGVGSQLGLGAGGPVEPDVDHQGGKGEQDREHQRHHDGDLPALVRPASTTTAQQVPLVQGEGSPARSPCAVGCSNRRVVPTQKRPSIEARNAPWTPSVTSAIASNPPHDWGATP